MERNGNWFDVDITPFLIRYYFSQTLVMLMPAHVLTIGLDAAESTLLENKRGFLLDLLRSEHWDLFNCELSESHCIGHHFWHFLDASHPDHDPRAPLRLRDAIATVYAGLSTRPSER